MYHKTYNFSAGPAMLPEAVLKEIQQEFLDYQGSGMSVMELSHRSALFENILSDTESDLRKLMGIPSNYEVLFIQGGATLQFSMVPLNLMKTCADYLISGSWSRKAWQEAAKFGDSAAKYESQPLRQNADYVYICENETIDGTAYQELPETGGPILVSDQSSCFLTKPVDIDRYGLIFAGVQKNAGPAGMAIVIIRKDLISSELSPTVPTYLRYDTHSQTRSLYNTPNCWSIYVCGKVFRHLLDSGGLKAAANRTQEKARLLYRYLDQSKLFYGIAPKSLRSLTNIPFSTGSDTMDRNVLTCCEASGIMNLQGHRSVGGLRASLYNAMPLSGVEALIDCLEDFERRYTGCGS